MRDRKPYILFSPIAFAAFHFCVYLNFCNFGASPSVEEF